MCERLEQEIKKAASLTSEAEPEASEAEPVATAVVRMEQLYSIVCPTLMFYRTHKKFIYLFLIVIQSSTI
jgi:hypothetical protein